MLMVEEIKTFYRHHLNPWKCLLYSLCEFEKLLADQFSCSCITKVGVIAKSNFGRPLANSTNVLTFFHI